MICANCKREIVDIAEKYSYTTNWVHAHSRHRECDRPNVAIPLVDGDRSSE